MVCCISCIAASFLEYSICFLLFSMSCFLLCHLSIRPKYQSMTNLRCDAKQFPLRCFATSNPIKKVYLSLAEVFIRVFWLNWHLGFSLWELHTIWLRLKQCHKFKHNFLFNNPISLNIWYQWILSEFNSILHYFFFFFGGKKSNYLGPFWPVIITVESLNLQLFCCSFTSPF